MGNQPTQETLDADIKTTLSFPLTLDGLASFINSDSCTNIAFLTGAGVSVSAGIPDFRSPGGMYDTLRPELLTATPEQQKIMRKDPTFVVNKKLFDANQLCYLELRRPFILGLAEGKWKATITHWFIDICHKKGKLRRLYTQNIDGLDFQTDIPLEKISPVHGSMGKIACESCGEDYPIEQFREKVKTFIKDIYKTDPSAPEQSTPIPCDKCGKPGLKPKTVLYGSSLPAHFHECMSKDFPKFVDLLVVAGTSLTVSPANALVCQVTPTTPRLLVNREKVGSGLGIKYGENSIRDIFCGQECDEVFLELVHKLGWMEDLKSCRANLAPKSLELLNKYLEAKNL